MNSTIHWDRCPRWRTPAPRLRGAATSRVAGRVCRHRRARRAPASLRQRLCHLRAIAGAAPGAHRVGGLRRRSRAPAAVHRRPRALPALPGWFDRVQVEQALINLLKNAHEAGGAGADGRTADPVRGHRSAHRSARPRRRHESDGAGAGAAAVLFDQAQRHGSGIGAGAGNRRGPRRPHPARQPRGRGLERDSGSAASADAH